jgi:hypothetical protein
VLDACGFTRAAGGISLMIAGSTVGLGDRTLQNIVSR